MVTKTIKQWGSGNCIPLDKTMLDILGIDRGSVVKIAFEGNRMIVEPMTVAEVDDRIVETGRKLAKKHHKLMKKLAE